MAELFKLKAGVSPNYFGGKSGAGTYQTIINQIPPHDTFISGCLGKCGILRNKRPAKYNFGIDIDPEVMDFWQPSPSLKLINASFWETTEYLKPDGGKTFIYLDPPYPKNARRSGKNVYTFEMSDDDHILLLQHVLKMRCNIAISTYPNDIYENYLDGWRRIQFYSQTRKGKALEYLYMNYPAPTQLHDCRYLGRDFRQREKWKRSKKNMLAKIAKLKPQQRNSLLNSIKEKYKI